MINRMLDRRADERVKEVRGMSKKESREIEILRKQLELLAEKSAVISKLSGHENLNHPNENSRR